MLALESARVDTRVAPAETCVAGSDSCVRLTVACVGSDGCVVATDVRVPPADARVVARDVRVRLAADKPMMTAARIVEAMDTARAGPRLGPSNRSGSATTALHSGG